MKHLAAALLIALAPALLLAGEPTAYVRSDGSIEVFSDGHGQPDLVIPATSVMYSPGAPEPPTPGPDDPGDEPTDPPENERVAEVARLSREVNDPGSAPIVATVVGYLASLEVENSANGKIAWSGALNTTFRAIGPPSEERWVTWRGSDSSPVAALAEGEYLTPFFRDVQTGLALAYDLDTAAVADLIERANSLVAQLPEDWKEIPEAYFTGADAQAAAAYMEVKHAEAGWDWTQIFQLIMEIIQLLRDLGIL